MNVNNVNNYQLYRKEYLRLSIAIQRSKAKGLDISQLLNQREQLKSLHSSQVNSSQSIQPTVNRVNKLQSVYSVNKVNNVYKELAELKSLFFEQQKQLENISQALTLIYKLIYRNK